MQFTCGLYIDCTFLGYSDRLRQLPEAQAFKLKRSTVRTEEENEAYTLWYGVHHLC
jgi:hypothetical protein